LLRRVVAPGRAAVTVGLALGDPDAPRVAPTGAARVDISDPLTILIVLVVAVSMAQE
jgi:hypothetical protein